MALKGEQGKLREATNPAKKREKENAGNLKGGSLEDHVLHVSGAIMCVKYGNVGSLYDTTHVCRLVPSSTSHLMHPWADLCLNH